MFGAGIWFENALMQIVLRHLVDIDVRDPMHRYLLTEVADECRHSMMFGEFIRRAGTPAYGPTRDVAMAQGPSGRALSYLAILAIEELLDFANRASMRDDRVHPMVRQISKLHVLEEARHVSFAKSYISESWPTLDAVEQEAVRTIAPALVAEIVELSLDPHVFEHLSIADGYEIAKANPAYRANVVDGLGKLTSFLTEVGIIVDPESWIELGLAGVDEPDRPSERHERQRNTEQFDPGLDGSDAADLGSCEGGLPIPTLPGASGRIPRLEDQLTTRVEAVLNRTERGQPVIVIDEDLSDVARHRDRIDGRLRERLDGPEVPANAIALT